MLNQLVSRMAEERLFRKVSARTTAAVGGHADEKGPCRRSGIVAKDSSGMAETAVMASPEKSVCKIAGILAAERFGSNMPERS